MVRWLRWHCPPDTGFEIRALAVWGRARYLSVTEAPHNTNFHTWMGKKQFCFFQTAETGNRTPDSGVKGSGANHYPRAPARPRVGASTSTQYLGTNTSTLKMFKYKYKYRVLQNVLGYYPSTLQVYLGTITKYQVQMYNITHKNIPVNA